MAHTIHLLVVFPHWIIGVAIVILGLVGYLSAPSIRRNIARRQFFKMRTITAGTFREVEKLSTDTDLHQGVLKRFKKLQQAFTLVDRITETDEAVDWFEKLKMLTSITKRINRVKNTMLRQLLYAQKERTEGAKFMETLPAMFTAAQLKLAGGNKSIEALGYLARARSLYEEAKSRQAVMSTINWRILFQILRQSDGYLGLALKTHKEANVEEVLDTVLGELVPQ